MKNLVKKSLYLIVCTSCLFFFGINCSSDSEEEESVNSAKSVTLADFDIDYLDMPVEDIEGEINQEEEFYCNYDDEEDICLENKIFSSAKFAGETDDGFFAMSVPDTNITECFNDADKVVMSIYFQMKVLDANGDPIDISGFSFDDLDSYSGPVSAAYMISKFYFSLSASENGTDFTVVMKGMDCSTDNPPEPYLLSDKEDGVSSYGLEDYEDSEGESSLKFTKLDFKNLTETDGTFYTGGTIDLQINNWNGTMTYHATDPETAPTYTASNGTDNVSGTFIGEDKAAKSYIFSDLKKNMVKKIKSKINRVNISSLDKNLN